MEKTCNPERIVRVVWGGLTWGQFRVRLECRYPGGFGRSGNPPHHPIRKVDLKASAEQGPRLRGCIWRVLVSAGYGFECC